MLGLVTEGPEGSRPETLPGSGMGREPALGAAGGGGRGHPSPASLPEDLLLPRPLTSCLAAPFTPPHWLSLMASLLLPLSSVPASPAVPHPPFLPSAGVSVRELVHLEASSQNKGTPGPARGDAFASGNVPVGSSLRSTQGLAHILCPQEVLSAPH